jgi:hypothetical protein
MHTLFILYRVVHVVRLFSQYFVCSLVNILFIVWTVSFADCSVFDVQSGQYLVYNVVSILFAVCSVFDLHSGQVWCLQCGRYSACRLFNIRFAE